MTENPYLTPPSDGEWQSPDNPAELSPEALEQERQRLREAVEYHSDLYYKKFDPVISDRAYDELYSHLERVEDELDIDDPSSPTNKVGTGMTGDQ